MKTINNFRVSLTLAALALILVIPAMLHAFVSIDPTAFAQTETNNNSNTTISTNNTTTASSNATGQMPYCEAIASQLGGQVVPNPTGICDVAVPIKGLEVIDNATGTRINQLLVINPIFEFAPIPDAHIVNDSNTDTTGTSTQVTSEVYGFAEIGAPEDQLLSVVDLLSNTSWNVVAVHNHVVLESPKMMFVHAVGMADIDTLTSDAKSVLENLNNLQQQNSTATAQQASGNEGASRQGAEQEPGQLTPPSATPNPLDS